jgi:hypothetical protein
VAREGDLALGDEAEHSGGTAAELHGTSPLPWPAGCPNQFTRRGEGCQSSAEFLEIQLVVMETIVAHSDPGNRTRYTIGEVLETWMSDVPREALQ